mmetsp:Transcript_122790/g.347999  ORF Transcript_122790/g.347999 Transcript_122790/m.347999 type:complete len:221 (-) Transcript_122790:1544-2206(-)
MPPAFFFRNRSAFCSGASFTFSLSRLLENAASGMLSAPFPASSAKNFSIVRLRCWIWDRRAEETCTSTEASMLSKAFCTLSVTILTRFPMPSIFSLDLAMLCFASTQGPLDAFVSLTSLFFRNSWTSLTVAESLAAAAFTAFCTVMGASTLASSDSVTEVNCLPASSSSFSSACAFSTLSVTTLRIREAAFFSFLSSCFLRSNSSRFEWSRLPSSIFFLS